MSRGSIFCSSHPADCGPDDACCCGRLDRRRTDQSPWARWAPPWAAIEPVLGCAPPKRHVVRLPRSLRRAHPEGQPTRHRAATVAVALSRPRSASIGRRPASTMRGDRPADLRDRSRCGRAARRRAGGAGADPRRARGCGRCVPAGVPRRPGPATIATVRRRPPAIPAAASRRSLEDEVDRRSGRRP